jgi:hypothetical protein
MLRPVPGQRFWLAWCDGLNMLELLLVLGWTVGHILCFWDLMRYYGKETQASTLSRVRTQHASVNRTR